MTGQARDAASGHGSAPESHWQVEPIRHVIIDLAAPPTERKAFAQVLRLRRSKTRIAATERDGWLHVAVTTDESVTGYAVTVNGKDLA